MDAMDSFPNNYYKIYNEIIMLIGHSVYPGREAIKWTLRIIYNFVFLNSVIIMIIYFFEHNFELIKLLEMFPIFITLFALLLNNIVTCTKDATFRIMWNLIVEDWASERRKEELKIKIFYTSISHFICKVILLLFGIGMAIFIIVTSCVSQILDYIAPLNDTRSRILPYPTISAFNEKKNFVLILLMQEVSSFLSVMHTILSLLIFNTYIIHVFGMFAEIGYRLQNALPENISSSNLTIKARDDIYYKSVCLCIKRHKRTIELVRALDDYYKFSFTVTISASVLIISPSLFTLVDTEFMDYKSILQIIFIVSFLFLISYFGQKLIDVSVDFGEKAYSSPWYRCSPYLQKLIILMIRRSDVPCQISAYNMYVASLSCFRMLLQTGVSYCMALRQFR